MGYSGGKGKKRESRHKQGGYGSPQGEGEKETGKSCFNLF